MTLAVQIGDWPAAEKWLRRWGRAGRSRGEIKQRRAILALAEAQSLLAKDDPAAQLAAVKKAEQAAMLDVKLLPATALAAAFDAWRTFAKSTQNTETGMAKTRMPCSPTHG